MSDPIHPDPKGPHPHAGDPIEPLTFGPLNPDIDDTLRERGGRYGSFTEHARVTQAIKSAMADSPNWQSLDADMREALEMNAHKVGRILCGDAAYHDSWHDIIGYTKLVADRLFHAPSDSRGVQRDHG